MTPDAVMVLVNGMVLGRDTIGESLNDSPPWASYELAEGRLVEVGGDAAAVVYKATASREGPADPFVAMMSSVYHLIDGEPRLALYSRRRSRTNRTSGQSGIWSADFIALRPRQTAI